MRSTTISPARSRQGALGSLVAGCLAVCIAQLALAMPATLNGLFQASLHPTGAQLDWISDAFLLPAAVLELSFGVVGDIFGRKRLLATGAVILGLGALVSATAGGIAQLWVGQALAGVGAAVLLPCSLAAVAHVTSDERSRARAVAAWAGALSTGGFLAPVLGGLTGNTGSWSLAFYVLTALAVLSAAVTVLAARESSAPEGRSLDWGGQVTVAIGLFAVLFGVIQGQAAGWGSVEVVTAFVVAAVFLGLFLFAESRAASPMLRLDLFRNRAFSAAAAVAVIGMFSYLGTAYAVSIRMGPIQHQHPLRIAVAYIIINGVTPALWPLTARLLQRMDPRLLLGSGLLFMAAGEFWLAALPITNQSLLALTGPLLLFGIGFALVLSAMTAAAVNTVPIRLAGMASAATGLLRDFGMTLGPAIVGAVALQQAAGAFGRLLHGSGLPAGTQRALAALAHHGGPLAVNGLSPSSPLAPGAPLAQSALGQGYSVGFLVCGFSALGAFGIALAFLRGGQGDRTETAAFAASHASETSNSSPGPG